MIIDTALFKDYINKLKAAEAGISELIKIELNRAADRHLARCKKNTPTGISPDSPSLCDKWDRSGVVQVGNDHLAEVFNSAGYASFWEFGRRQTPERIVFIELLPGQSIYGYPAREVKSGKHAGKWGVTIPLKSPYARGAFVMTGSEQLDRRELDAAASKISKEIERKLQ